MCISASVALFLTVTRGGWRVARPAGGRDDLRVVAKHWLRRVLRERLAAGVFGIFLMAGSEENPAQRVICVHVLAGFQFAADQFQGSLQIPVLVGVDQGQGAISFFA